MNTSAHAGKNHGHDGLHHKFWLDLVARQLGDRGEAERRFPRAVRRPHVAEDERERRAQEAEERRIRRAVWGNRHRERPPPRRAQAPMCYVWYEDNQGTVSFYLARGDFDLLTPPRLKLSVLRPWARSCTNKFSKKGCGAPSPRGGLAAAVLVATLRSWQAKADATEEGCDA